MSGSNGGDNVCFKRLLKRWNVVLGSVVLFLISGFILLSLDWDTHYAWRWVVLSAAGTTYLIIILRRNLSANPRKDETELLPEFGWGNGLSIMRGVLAAGLAGFLFSPQPIGWVAWPKGVLMLWV